MLQSAGKTKKQPKSYDFDCSLGGATRNRTGDRGVADLCLTAWPWRHIQLGMGSVSLFRIIFKSCIVRYCF